MRKYRGELMKMTFDEIYYEPQIMEYELGKFLLEKYKHLPKFEITSHNKIEEFRGTENKDFPKLKAHLIIGTRKTHKYVENHKVSDFLVPYTSSGCRAMCLYCYLVCNYNKYSYLRLFVNREEMLSRLIKHSHKSELPLTYEIGSNSDLIMENVITNNLEYTINNFARNGRGKLTFPSKFDMVEPLLNLEHKKKIIFRMSVNPSEIVKRVEIGTSSLKDRVIAVNKMAEADYEIGLLIAPVIMVDDWEMLYSELIDFLSDSLSAKVKRDGFIEIILMSYSFVHNAINSEAFKSSMPIFDKEKMKGRGRGKYNYKDNYRKIAEDFFYGELAKKLPDMKIIYIS